MSNNQRWFWTPERLEKLRRVLDELAEHDAKGAYFGPAGLEPQVRRLSSRHGLNVPRSIVGKGISILVYLDIIAPGERGVKPRNYRRPYYSNKPRVTVEDINRYRQSLGVDSELPPSR